MSNLPDNFAPGLPEKWDVNAEMIPKTLAQVEKDFALQGLKLSLDNSVEEYKDCVAMLAEAVEELDLIHSDNLAGVLYRVDLSEKAMREALTHSAPEKTYLMLADKILQRCFEKVLLRKKFDGAG